MTKCDKVENKHSAELLYGIRMINHVISKVKKKNRSTKCTKYWFNNDTVKVSKKKDREKS